MKTLSRGTRLANKSKQELESNLSEARMELARLDFYPTPDTRLGHIQSWRVRARRNILSRIGRINSALRIKSDIDFVELVRKK